MRAVRFLSSRIFLCKSHGRLRKPGFRTLRGFVCIIIMYIRNRTRAYLITVKNNCSENTTTLRPPIVTSSGRSFGIKSESDNKCRTLQLLREAPCKTPYLCVIYCLHYTVYLCEERWFRVLVSISQTSLFPFLRYMNIMNHYKR